MHAGALFQRLVGRSCAQLGSLAAVSADPDIADDTFLLAGRGLAYCPRIVLAPAVLPGLLDAALAGILVQHRRAHAVNNLP
jgi:transportin-3